VAQLVPRTWWGYKIDVWDLPLRQTFVDKSFGLKWRRLMDGGSNWEPCSPSVLSCRFCATIITGQTWVGSYLFVNSERGRLLDHWIFGAVPNFPSATAASHEWLSNSISLSDSAYVSPAFLWRNWLLTIANTNAHKHVHVIMWCAHVTCVCLPWRVPCFLACLNA
jgi:hypothetical protein